MLQAYQHSFETVITNFQDRMRPSHHGSDLPRILSQKEVIGENLWQIETRKEGNVISHDLRCWAIDGKPRRVPATVQMLIFIGLESSADSLAFDPKTLFAVFGLNGQETDGSLGVINFRLHGGLTIREAYYENMLRLRVNISTFSANLRNPSFLRLDSYSWIPGSGWTTSWFALEKLQGIETDVKVIVGNQEIKAHRMILGYRYTYFKDLLYPINGNEVILDDCDYEATCTALRFIYTNECFTEPENLAKVLLIGKKFALKDLLISCFQLLTPGNVPLFVAAVDYLREVDDHNKTNLWDDFWNYVKRNLSSVLSSEEFWSLADEEIMSFIERPEIKLNIIFSELKPKLMKRRREATSQTSSSRDSLLCVVCQENTVDTMVIPCNHLSLCSKDAERIQQMDPKRCPVCRADITSFSKVFLP